MRGLTLIALLIITITTWGQTNNSQTRTIKGLVIDKVTKTTPVGTNILQYKTANGAVVDKDGMFEMEVQKGDTILIQIPFCFESYYIMYLPTDDFKKIILDKKLKKESERIIKLWTKTNDR